MSVKVFTRCGSHLLRFDPYRGFHYIGVFISCHDSIFTCSTLSSFYRNLKLSLYIYVYCKNKKRVKQNLDFAQILKRLEGPKLWEYLFNCRLNFIVCHTHSLIDPGSLLISGHDVSLWRSNRDFEKRNENI